MQNVTKCKDKFCYINKGFQTFKKLFNYLITNDNLKKIL